jgi:hypothetical protein
MQMLKHVKRGWNYVATNWQAAAAYVLITAVLLVLYTFRLGTLVPGFSPAEIQARNDSSSLKVIVDNPINAPHKVGQYVLLKLNQKGAFAMRLVSVFYAILTVWILYALLIRWHTQRTAIFGTVLFATTSWFLHSARSATPNILLGALLAIATCGFYIRYGRIRSQAWLMASIIIGMSLYVPYMAWFVLLGALWQVKLIRDSIRVLSPLVITWCIAIFTACLIPLIIALIRTPDLWHQLLGIPPTFAAPVEILKNIGRVPFMIFGRAQLLPEYWLGRMPVLDLFAAVMFIFGVYAYAYKVRLHRTQLLIAVFVIGASLIGLTASYENVTLLMPFVYIVVAAGITLMLQQWFTVFPRNPIARSIGAVLMTCAILTAVAYQLINYYVAWPNNANTKKTYSIRA